jgi:hypothetical protein
MPKNSRSRQPKIATDEDVAAYLRQRAPLLYQEFRADAKRYKEFRQKTVLESDMAAGLEASELNPIFAGQASALRSKRHWAEEVFAGCGRAEICDIVEPHISAQDCAILFGSLVEGATAAQLSESHKIGISAVRRTLIRVRRTVIRKIKNGEIAAPHFQESDPSTGDYIHTSHPNQLSLAWWEALLQQSIKPYRKPAHKPPIMAHVCDCGHHFVNADRVCPYCSKRWDQKDWHLLWR